MKKILLPSFAITALLFAGCNNNQSKENNGKTKLVFQPEKGKAIKMSYEFSVNSIASNAVTTFNMVLSGSGETDSNGNVTLELKNDSVRMHGNISGQEVSGSAGGNDSITEDLKLVALPVFALWGKTYRSIYNSQLDKKTEVQISGNEIVDSMENKMQILLRYPDHDVAVGDSWEKEIFVKAGNKMNCAAKYTLTEIKGDSATITVSGKLDGKGESFGNEFTIDGKLDGSFIVNIKNGWPLDTKIHQEFTLKMGGKDLPMKYSINSKVE